MMAAGSRRRGDRAEREVRALINDLLGIDAPRIRAGNTHDVGDLALANTTVEIKSYLDVGRAVRDCLDDLEDEHGRTTNTFAVGFVRRPGGRYAVVMSPEMWATYWRETL